MSANSCLGPNLATRPRALRCFLVFAIALCAGSAFAELVPASLRAWAGSYADRTGFDVTQAGEPLIQTYSNGNGGADVWTAYGVNKAGSTVSLGTYYTANDEKIWAGSKWTDVLTVYTPDAPVDTWLHLLFSVHLDGLLVANEYGASSARSQVTYAMLTGGEGSWISRPNFSASVSGPRGRIDVDQTFLGDVAIRNGHTFNLISDLETFTTGYLMGPPSSSTLAESAFGDTAQWMGGTLWIGDRQAEHFSITAASGHDYALHSTVPEPATGWLAICGIAGLLAARRLTPTRS